MNTFAVRLVFKVPIIWMTGYYSLKNAKVFHFIPAGGSGNFNVDLKFVTIEVVATLRSTNESLNILKRTRPLDDPHSTTRNSSSIPNNNIRTNMHMVPGGNTTKPHDNTDKRNKRLLCLDVFEVGVHWRKAVFKFDGLWKGFGHLTDFSLNQVLM